MKKDNNWNAVLTVAVFFILVGIAVFIIQSTTKKEINFEDNNDKTETKEIINNEETKEEEYDETEEFTNQDGEEVKVSGDKVVSATGFAGASNYKFYLRNGTLYFKNISKDDEEEIIATGVKDLYLENKEVTAELGENGKIVKENNYVTYK
ncbi:MAG: hypothetical protein IJI49_05245 [Bacilli bacterium]|nr:hypothetical protein [Bacilli bacterium]